MNIQEIKHIINSAASDDVKRTAILNSISNDEKALPDLFDMLQEERRFKNEFFQNINLEFNKAQIFIKAMKQYLPEDQKWKGEFICNEIDTFYNINAKFIMNVFEKDQE